MAAERKWWKQAVVYQIYPRSFNDSDGDGIGDLPGITAKIDYLDELGIDVVWLNPVYDSPFVDNGYDIRDYRAISDEFGTMADWEALRDGLHRRGIRLIMDLVVNHTSDEHEWFRKSRREEGEYADYYVWEPGEPDRPPNNWESFFGGSAWSYDDEREAWYLHLYDEKQPDLNWRNPDVREEIYEMMRWWIEKDIDGFRMDVINTLSQPRDLPDGDPDAAVVGSEHFVSGPGIHDRLQEMYERVLSNHDIMTVGETVDVTVEEARQFREDGLDMVFSFQHMHLDRGEEGPWDIADWNLEQLRDVTTRWERGLGERTWHSVFLGNHDQPRMVSRFGNDEEYRARSATMLATYLFTLQGTPFMFQGDEIGMTNPTFDSMDEFRDERVVQWVETARERGRIESFDGVKKAVNYWSRDNSRTPMQWSDAENAGFTEGDPWIKLNENYPDVNVERARERGGSLFDYYRRGGSILDYYRRLIQLYHEHQTLVYGTYQPILEDHPEILAYLRYPSGGGNRLFVMLNFFGGEPSFETPVTLDLEDPDVLIANYEVDSDDHETFDLRPYEARVYELP